MVFTEKRIRRIKCFLFSLLIICLTPLCESGRLLKGAINDDECFAGREIVCAIDLGDDMRGAHGLETGFNYELLQKFAQDNRCEVRILTPGKSDDVNYIDSIENGSLDIYITHIEGNESIDGLSISHAVRGCSAWVTSDKDARNVMQINRWLNYFSATKEYESVCRRYFNSTNPIKRAQKGIIAENVSPYDDLLKKYAAELGWDWRMLAAVVYQESKFSINSRSHRGATGLMQVMPGNGVMYGVTDLVNPEYNLYAGTAHLKRLQRLYSGNGFSQEELIKFTLAAYNAGEGRVKDCRSLAASMNLDNKVWDNIVKVIPMMREETILEDESVKLGIFQGYETIAYIENIMEIYQAICKIHPKV